MKTLTVITTTYNRAYCLHQLYESLLRQTSKDFLWMIVDDGSIDDTKDLVKSWIDENKIEIQYIYKPNGGMHTARNKAYEEVKTELNVIIDSDDWMTDDAVEKIVSFWDINRNEKYYGVVTNNVTPKGQLVGTPLPKNVKACTLTALTSKYKVAGDKKLVLRSDLAKLYPYPEFEGEKFYPASYKFRLLDLNYELLILDEYTCVVDYNEDSMTFSKFAQYRTCAKGFAHYRNEMIRISKSASFIIKNMIHYIAESKYANNKKIIRNSSRPILAFFMYPVGLGYYLYLQKTRRKY
jgi:glycosyltransferase involved in cell wall biosynthesis